MALRNFKPCLFQCTADVSEGIPLKEFMKTLTVHGKLIMVAIPDNELPSLTSSGVDLCCFCPPLHRMLTLIVIDLAGNGALLGGSKLYICIHFCIFLLIHGFLQREQEGSSGNARPRRQERRQALDRGLTQLSPFLIPM